MSASTDEEPFIDPDNQRLTLPEVTDVEGDPKEVPELDEIGNLLWEDDDIPVEVSYPTKPTDNNWVFRNDGYAGRIELENGWSVILEPKVTIGNLFRMLEYAYDIKSFEFLDGLYESGSVSDFFDRLVNLLSKRVLRRQKQGYYKQYVDREEESETIRGRINFSKSSRRPWDVKHHIEYSELTVDNPENQILLWTLFKALGVGLENEDALRNAKRAYRTLNGNVSLNQFRASECADRDYNRLNQDYDTLHTLCRLILDNTGPTHTLGQREMIPFRVEMPTLYELFVARWLDQYVRSGLSVSRQERYYFGDTGKYFQIDFVLYEGTKESGTPLCVADTKYTDESSPDTDDIAQVVAYAEAKGVTEAFLVYPSIETPLDITVGDVRVRTLTFELDGDLEDNGGAFGYELLSAVGEHP